MTIVRYLRSWIQRLMLVAACAMLFVGCDQTKPEKFAGFASEQLSEQIEIVSAKLDESIEDNQQTQSEILRAVRDLSETVAGMQLASQKQVEELKKVSGKAKTKLTSTGDEKAEVATLDPNAAPSAKLEIDSLDEAAEIIAALTKRVDELDKRCQCGKMSATKSTEQPTYQTVSNASGGNSSGSMKAVSGNSNGSNYRASYSTPVYSEVTYSQPVYSQPIISAPVGHPLYQSTVSSQCYIDPVTGRQVCNESVQQASSQLYRAGLFGRKIPVR